MLDGWKLLKAAFQAVVEQPGDMRVEMVRRFSERYPELGRQLSTLVDQLSNTVEFMEEPACLAWNAQDFSLGVEDIPAAIGPYHLLGILGRGGMSNVYLGRDDSGKEVALKVPNRVWALIDSGQIRKEGEIMAPLHHPHIVQLLATGDGVPSGPYLVLEFIKGRPIDQFCREENLSLETRLGLFCKVCEAVVYAHGRQVIHRDLKPNNIQVTERGRPVLLDFGVSVLWNQKVQVSASRELDPMTPEYASPELVTGSTITPAADVYSLGVLLYFLLCDERPYQLNRGDFADIEQAVCFGRVRPPSLVYMGECRRSRGLVVQCDRVVLRALRKNPVERYSSVADLLSEIHEILHCA